MSVAAKAAPGPAPAPGERSRSAWAWIPSLYVAEGLPYCVTEVLVFPADKVTATVNEIMTTFTEPSNYLDHLQAGVVFARDTMGPNVLLAPEQAVVLETDPDRARELARGHMQIYLGLRNYVSNLLRMGFTEDDVGGGGSDRLVDAIVATGEQAAADRIQAHLDAGADHVCVQVLARTPKSYTRLAAIGHR